MGDEAKRDSQVASEVAAAIEQLKQGILFDNKDLVLPAFKTLYEAGTDSISPLLDELNRVDFTSIEKPQIASLVSGFITILNELSEPDSVALINRANIDKCHPIVAAAFRSVLQFSTANFRKSKVGEIEILEHKSIDRRYRATRHVSNWLGKVSPKHLGGLSRLYIIAPEAHFDFAGNYLKHVAVITVVWNTDLHPWVPFQWPFRLHNEQTLYHEIGHHYHRHMELGQVPQQEEEANSFAAEQMRRSHVWIATLARTIGGYIPVKRALKTYWLMLECHDREGRYYQHFEIVAPSESQAKDLATSTVEADGNRVVQFDEVEQIDDGEHMPTRPAVVEISSRAYVDSH